jgi:hypothetical protein
MRWAPVTVSGCRPSFSFVHFQKPLALPVVFFGRPSGSRWTFASARLMAAITAIDTITSPQTVQRFMNVAQVYGDKSSIVEHLTPSALYELAAPSTPSGRHPPIGVGDVLGRRALLRSRFFIFYFFRFAARPLAGEWSARHRTAAGSIRRMGGLANTSAGRFMEGNRSETGILSRT